VAGLIYLTLTTLSNLVFMALEQRFPSASESQSMIELIKQYWQPYLYGTLTHPTGWPLLSG